MLILTMGVTAMFIDIFAVFLAGLCQSAEAEAEPRPRSPWMTT